MINEGGIVTNEGGRVINEAGNLANEGGRVIIEWGIVIVVTLKGLLGGGQVEGRHAGALEESR